MKVTFLGTGTSCGVPVIGCQCKVCTSTDPRDIRTRCSALVETETTRIMIDCGPDFRQQILKQPFRKIDAVFITHTHYDHVGGLDDLRPYCKFGDIDIYANQRSCDNLHHTLPYCFAKEKYPGVPQIHLHSIAPHEVMEVGDIRITPIEVMHGKIPILGYRFNNFAYITDMKTMADEEKKFLKGIDTLVVNGLRFDKPHHSHQLIDDAISFAREIGARRTFLIHVCHDIGLIDEANARLPEGVSIAYDGEVVDMPYCKGETGMSHLQQRI